MKPPGVVIQAQNLLLESLSPERASSEELVVTFPYTLESPCNYADYARAYRQKAVEQGMIEAPFLSKVCLETLEMTRATLTLNPKP